MKQILPIVFLLFFSLSTFAQKDKKEVKLHSVSTAETEWNNILLISNYYPLKDNIDSKLSSAYISKNPRLKDIQKAAVELPSEFFILTKDSQLLGMILFNNSPERNFLFVEMKANRVQTYPCDLVGDLSENRANEIIKEGYDDKASIENSVLTFNRREFQIIKNKSIENAVKELIKKEKLNETPVAEITIPSQLEIKKFILKESQPEGKLDFFTEIKDHEMDGVQIRPGLFANKKSVALYKWGRACYDIGVNTAEDVIKIYEEFTNEDATEKEKRSLISGFEKAWDK